MADSSAAQGQKRLSVWAATEPLPVPLPPPPRARTAPPRVTQPELHQAHPTPPQPHIEHSTPEPQSIASSSSMPEPSERSLRSPTVLASLAISTLLLAGLGWLQWRQPDALNWNTVKFMTLDGLIEADLPDSELPYITVVPIVPTPCGTTVVERKAAKKTKQVTMSDITFAEPDPDRTTEMQRR